MKIKMPHVFHKWTKWETKQEGQIEISGLNVGRYEIQRRHCDECGKSQCRFIKAMY